MRLNLGKKPFIYPQPVLIIGTYNEDGTPDAMTAAWGGVGDDTQVFLCLSPEHKTVGNILRDKQFTVSIGTLNTLAACDYVGIDTANKVKDKIKRSGLTPIKAEHVNAPIFEELPLALECELISYEPKHCHLFGEIIATSADETILTDGKPDPAKLKAISYSIADQSYLLVGEKVGKAFSDGLKLR